MPFRPTIYHPYLHITAERWICTAALYWDRVIRVTMQGVRLRDAENVHRMDDALGLFEVREASEFEREVSQTYVDLLHRGLEKCEPWAVEIVGRLPVERASAKTFRAFQMERHTEIISALKGWGLAQEFAGGWWGTTRRLLDAYMEVCCTYVAEKAGADLLTDQFVFDVSGWRVLAGCPAEGDGDRVPCLHLELPLVALNPPIVLEPEAARTFRAECAEARRAYAQEIQSIQGELDSATSLSQIGGTMRAHSGSLRVLLKTFRTALAKLGYRPVPCWLILSWCPRSLASVQEAPQDRWVRPGFAVRRTMFAQGTRLNANRLRADSPRSWTLLLDRSLVARTPYQRLREHVGL